MSILECHSSATRRMRRFSRSWPNSTSIRSRRSQALTRKPMGLRRTRFRSFHSTMTKIFLSNSRGLLTAVAAIAAVASGALAQTSVTAPAPAVASPASATPLTLGDAARLAAHQRARARGRKADLLPTVSSYVQEAGRTFNTSTLGIDFPATPGNPPLFDPQGQVEGPINTLDVRGRVQQNLLDFGAIGRVRSAQAQARSSSADADASAEQAANIATSAYIRAMRADADLRARQADTRLATELLSIAQSQLQAGTGVGLDVTRAKAQLAATRAALITSRNARDHAHLDLLRSIALPLGTDVLLADS